MLWARGTLDEKVEHTGALRLALAALRRALHGPEVVLIHFEIGTDASSLSLRGSLADVTALWHRLPFLFARDIDLDGRVPEQEPGPAWHHDLLLRTGDTAAVLQPVARDAEGATEEVRRLLRALDPVHGEVPRVFCTDQESLIGETFEVEPVSRRAAAPLPEDRAVVGPVDVESSVLSSVLLPRSAEGEVAAGILHDLLAEEVLAADIAPYRRPEDGPVIRVESTPLREHVHLVLSAVPLVPERGRPDLVTGLLRRLRAVSEADLAAAAQGWAPDRRRERDRAVHGLPPATAPTAAGVRAALDAAVRTLHAAVDPERLDPRAHPELSALPVVRTVPLIRAHGDDVPAGAEVLRPSLRAVVGGTARRGLRVLVTEDRIQVDGMGFGRGGSPYEYDPEEDHDVVGLDRLLAVEETPWGDLILFDREGERLFVPGRLLSRRGRSRLHQLLEPALQGVPRLASARPWPRPERWDRAFVLSSLVVGGLLLVPVVGYVLVLLS
ncbi:hypothetical protein GCM10028787_28540 [Brachybacterium horti]